MKTRDEVGRDGRWIGTASGRHRVLSLGTFAVVVSLVACLHFAFWALNKTDATAASVEDRLPSVSYNRFASAGSTVPEAQIRADLTAIAAQAKAVRTYGSTQGLERVPEIAAELGLKVTLGAWIGRWAMKPFGAAIRPPPRWSTSSGA
jgi:exo-beta-1,3-glucanase (GH17 family)